METIHPVEGSFGAEFLVDLLSLQSYGSLKSQVVEFFCVKISRFFGKTTPYGKSS